MKWNQFHSILYFKISIWWKEKLKKKKRFTRNWENSKRMICNAYYILYSELDFKWQFYLISLQTSTIKAKKERKIKRSNDKCANCKWHFLYVWWQKSEINRSHRQQQMKKKETIIWTYLMILWNRNEMKQNGLNSKILRHLRM